MLSQNDLVGMHLAETRMIVYIHNIIEAHVLVIAEVVYCTIIGLEFLEAGVCIDDDLVLKCLSESSRIYSALCLAAAGRHNDRKRQQKNCADNKFDFLIHI